MQGTTAATNWLSLGWRRRVRFPPAQIVLLCFGQEMRALPGRRNAGRSESSGRVGSKSWAERDAQRHRGVWSGALYGCHSEGMSRLHNMESCRAPMPGAMIVRSFFRKRMRFHLLSQKVN